MKVANNTISGHVLKQSNGKGLGHIKVQFLNESGTVVKTTMTNGKGVHAFKVSNDGACVVHKILPKKFTQVSPSFGNTSPTGAYGPGFGATSWNYVTGNSDPANGPVGDLFWASIAPAGKLPFESPMNITGPATDLSKSLSINYASAAPSKTINNGHQIQVQFPTTNSTDTITLGRQTFTLSQFHSHDPSENQVAGQSYSMEEHFVNVSVTGGETVVAVFLQLGAHNSSLDPIMNAATSSLTKSGDLTTSIGVINFSGLLPTSRFGWFYQGSLTTPPLSQEVNWLVLATPIMLDFAQFQQYEAVAAGAGFLPNNRPFQPADGRRTNEFNDNVDFESLNVTNLNFTVSPTLNTASTKAAKLRANA